MGPRNQCSPGGERISRSDPLFVYVRYITHLRLESEASTNLEGKSERGGCG